MRRYGAAVTDIVDRGALWGPAWMPERLRRLAGPSGVPPKYVRYPDDVPRDERGELIDSGYWRERTEVTHWHLCCSEWSVNDAGRFDNDAARAERAGRPSDGCAWSPREVTDWHLAKRIELARSLREEFRLAQLWGLTDDGMRLLQEETAFRMAMFGRDVCGVFRLRGQRIAHLSAYAMTERTCRGLH